MKARDTRTLIHDTPETHRHTLEVYSNLIAQETVRGRRDAVNEYAKMLRGYLTCMKDAGMICDYELRALYLWYRSSLVDKNIRDGNVK